MVIFCLLIIEFPCIVPSRPLVFNLTPIGDPNQLMASWSPPDPTNGIITAYTVFCKMPSDEEFTIRDTLNNSTLSATIMKLMPFTNYECYVTANTSVGEGPPSNNDTAMTDEDGELILFMHL